MQTHMRLNSLFAQLLLDKKPDFLRADLGGKRYQRILEVLDNTIHYDNRLLKLRKVKKNISHTFNIMNSCFNTPLSSTMCPYVKH